MSSQETPKSPKDELRLYKEARKKNKEMEVGQIFYVISAKWYRDWKNYVKYSKKDGILNQRPGSIDNSNLIEREKCDDGEVQMKLGLQERYDYQLISEPEWNLLHSWY
jgi:hypothetical protein